MCDGEGCVKDGEGFCGDCFVKEWEEDPWDCNDCRERFGAEANAERLRLRNEVECQRQEIRSLRQENAELRRREEER